MNTIKSLQSFKSTVLMAALCATVVLASIFSINCGKKGPLQLEPSVIPPPIQNLKVFQQGTNLKLQFDFPSRFEDKKKKEIDLSRIDRIDVYYSDHEIPGDKFQKKSKIIKKFKMSDLTEFIDSSSTSQNTNAKKNSFNALVPFKLKDLDNKNHFLAVRYSYQKKNSPISSVYYILSIMPIKTVSGLKINRETKVIKLTWFRPQTDESGKPISTIAGYNIFKRIEVPQTNETPTKPKPGEPLKRQPAPVFKKINTANVLTEYFEDWDTGINGTYSYYITTVISKQIESSPSEIISADITDIYPPDVPVNVVSFHMSDHIFITWLDVKDTDFSHYRVYRKVSENSPYKLLADNVTIINYKDTSVQHGKTYYYTITAVDKKGNESTQSKEVKEEY